MTNPYVIPGQMICAGPGCKQLHTPVNGWFVLTVKADWFGTEPWYEGYKLGPSDMPVCGAECAMKLYQQYLAKAVGFSQSRSSAAKGGQPAIGTKGQSSLASLPLSTAGKY